ncbi:hypothetical protein [Streptomyces antibioticus]|uniref:Uncharacterized protein n=1 Tax=Streptomyces antibioticus TaxID=1890 RepID=A0AAE7CIY9_STRAT|nr:hypothetical protein [Streptomyces antibioticus]OOQ55342.1 hypothetical protein AFM16_04905 [Streptomyces antibioticus]QIT42981.1 hypothetical protein HCX60_05115 [Streptomyces antibioticus]
MQPHFHFGLHPEHGVVARATAAITPHLADWYLQHEQFEPVPGRPDLYRLTRPDQDLRRRARQTVHDLRRHGFTVHADLSLDPAVTAAPPCPAQTNCLAERRARIAQAASARSPQHRAGASPQVTAPAMPSAVTRSSTVARTR